MFKPVSSILKDAKRLRSVFTITLLALAFVKIVFPADASADEWACRSLQIQIDKAPRSQPSGRDSTQAGRYAKAITAQNAQIDKVKSQLRGTGCSGSVITLGSGGNKTTCSTLSRTLKSMNANMSKLKAQYSRLSKGGGTVSSRDVLKARYNAMGCGQDNNRRLITAKLGNNQQPKSNISAILGDTKAKREERKRSAENSEIPGLSFSGDTFRTLCVRKCDGYYFPISFSTTKENFKRDTVACETMCPGTEVELFMHKVPEEESEDMISQTGKPYKAMSYAFAYRGENASPDPACRCQALQGIGVLNSGNAGSSGIANIDGKAIEALDSFEIANTVPVPMPRADSLFDRESVADGAGDLTNEDIIAVFEPQITSGSAHSSMRVVGPVFLPDPSGAIELKAPVRPLMR